MCMLIPRREKSGAWGTKKYSARRSIRLTEAARPEDFLIPWRGGASQARVRVIDMATDLVTRERIVAVRPANGAVRAEVSRDILKVAAVDRTLSPGKIFTGLIKGFGLKSGALACSAAWDTTDIVVVGVDDADMACAINRIRELQGGAVLCSNGAIMGELPLPLFGIMSDAPLREIDRGIKTLSRAASRLGVPFPDPVLSLIALTGAAIPFLRICEEGLVDLKEGRTCGLFLP